MVRRLIARFFPVAVALWAATASGQAPPDWDQQRVTQLAAEFARTVQAITEDSGARHAQPTAIQQREHDAALVDLSDLNRAAFDLVDMLKSGKGYAQTRTAFRRVVALRESIRGYAADSQVSDSVHQRAEDARAVLRELGRYYAEKIDLD